MNNDWLTMEAIAKGFLIALLMYIISILPLNMSNGMNKDQSNLIKQYLDIRDYKKDIGYQNFSRGIKNSRNQTVSNNIIYDSTLEKIIIAHYRKEFNRNNWQYKGVRREYVQGENTYINYEEYRKDSIKATMFSMKAGVIRFNYDLQ